MEYIIQLLPLIITGTLLFFFVRWIIKIIRCNIL